MGPRTIGVHEHGFIRIHGYTLLDKGAYTKLALNNLCHIRCFPSDILKRTELLESKVHVPARPLVAALQNIDLNTRIQYGYYETEESKNIKYFNDAIRLFREHLQKENAFIGVHLDVAVASGEETYPGAPVQLNFMMLKNAGGRPIQFGQTVHINLAGMLME